MITIAACGELGRADEVGGVDIAGVVGARNENCRTMWARTLYAARRL
jgi:hypothetical protein